MIDRLRPANVDHPLCPDHWWIVTPGSVGTVWRNIGKWGLNRHGTMANGAVRTSVRPGGFGALALDGTNDYIQVSWPTGQPTSHTFALWVRSASDTSTNRYVLDIDAGRLIYVWTTGGNLALHDGTAFRSFGAAPPNDGLWHHLVWVADAAAGQCRIYKDGVAYGSAATYSARAPGGQSRFFHHSTDPSNVASMDGALDDARWYGRVLSAREVAALYAESRRGHPETLRWVTGRITGTALLPPPPPIIDTRFGTGRAAGTVTGAGRMFN